MNKTGAKTKPAAADIAEAEAALPEAGAALPEVAAESLSFEAALSELEAIVGRLERGDVPLAQSITIYERGEALKKHCETLLRAAEDKVEKIRLSNEGAPQGTESLD